MSLLGTIAGIVLPGLFGGSSKPQQQQATVSPLSQYLQALMAARMQATALGTAPRETYTWQDIGSTQNQNTRTSQQRGGQGYPRLLGNTGGPEGGSVWGSASSWGRESQQTTKKATTAAPTMAQSSETAYRQALLQGLMGMGGLPQQMYQSAWNRGQSALDAQAQQSRARLQGDLGRRGVLNSGMYGTAMADVERAKLGGMSELSAQLASEQLAAQRNFQQMAMELYLRELEDSKQRKLQRDISNQGPSGGDILGGLAEAYASMYGGSGK